MTNSLLLLLKPKLLAMVSTRRNMLDNTLRFHRARISNSDDLDLPRLAWGVGGMLGRSSDHVTRSIDLKLIIPLPPRSESDK